MKIICAMPCLIVLLCACTALKQAPVTQGLSGYIYLKKGNQMPSPGRPISIGRGVSRDIYIYQPTKITQTEGASPLFSRVNTKLVARTKSDSTGHYSVTLPPGRYSVFVSENSKLFAAISNSDGELNPVDIMVKNISEYDIIITINTVY